MQCEEHKHNKSSKNKGEDQIPLGRKCGSDQDELAPK
jgi:hypothetical protein